jgi:CHASE2 domain-containing sensor protein
MNSNRNATGTLDPPAASLLWCLLLATATFVPWLPRLSQYGDRLGPLGRWSYDWLFALRETSPQSGVVIIEMDDKSFDELKHPAGALWKREAHAQLLRNLTRDGARVVVFDVLFGGAGETNADQELAQAMRAHGKVAIAVEKVRILRRDASGQNFLEGWESVFPAAPMRSAAAALGLVTPPAENGGVVREHFHELEGQESLPWAAARLAGAAGLHELNQASSRWIFYYGPPAEALTRLPYAEALRQPEGHFRDQYVFIGGSLRIKKPGELADTFRTPYTTWDRERVSGVDLVALNFLNLIHGDFLTRLPPLTEALLLLVCAGIVAIACLLAGFWVRMAALLFVAAGVTGLGLMLPPYSHAWFSWLLPLFTQIPVGLAWSLWLRHRAVVPFASGELVGVAPARPAPSLQPPSPALEPAVVADHTLLRKVGTGAYGEVWIARNAVGILHAVKIIHRRAFESSAPFEREFRGITRFMPISRAHAGFVHVLQVGPEEVQDFFYYVMELADDASREVGRSIDAYEPTTLSSHLKAHKRLVPEECLRLGLQITDALSCLHEAQLIHRDIKPSNIIFVQGKPKLADIGLVTRMAQDRSEVSFLGTRGYIAPEGPGTPAADVYSLGKVLYEAFTGLDREQFPSLPTSLLDAPDRSLAELNQVVLRACEVDPRQRYQSAAEFRERLNELWEKIRRRKEQADGPSDSGGDSLS